MEYRFKGEETVADSFSIKEQTEGDDMETAEL